MAINYAAYERRAKAQEKARKALKLKTVKTADAYRITDKEAKRLDKDMWLNSRVRDYGMSPRMVDALIDRHRNGNANMRRVIENQLDDINYHREAALLREGNYKEAYKENLKYHESFGTKPTKQYQRRMDTVMRTLSVSTKGIDRSGAKRFESAKASARNGG